MPPSSDILSRRRNAGRDESGQYALRGMALLDSALEKFARGLPALAMDEVVLGLRTLRDEDQVRWREFATGICRHHPIAELLREDPFTRRSLRKPRGYPGDPRMLDFIFSPDEIPEGTSDLGASIYGYTTDGPAPRSVRARAAMTARMIDDMAGERALRVLGVMAGHLWEARLSHAAAAGDVEKFLAFDQDARTLAAIDASGLGPGITTYQGTLRSLFRGKSVFRNFDLIYSPLCDNIPEATAPRFVSTLFDALAPGGRLLLSNFAPELLDAGYMEAFMDWHLIYRDEAGLARLADHLPSDRIADARTYRDPHGNIVFLDITRL